MVQIFRVFVPTSVIALLISEFVLICVCYVSAAFMVLRVAPLVFLLDDIGWIRIALLGLTLAAAIYFHDLYTQIRVKSRFALCQQLVVVVGTAFLVQSLLAYLRLRDLILPTGMMLAGSSLAIVALPAWRIFYARVVVRAMASERVLFLGSSPVIAEIIRHLADHPETGMIAVGYIGDSTDDTPEISGVQRLGCISQLTQIVQETKPQRIVVGLLERRTRLPVNQLLEIRLSGVHVEDVLSTYEATFGRISTVVLRPSQLIFSATELGPNASRVMLQSIYSFAIATFAAIMTAPVMLVSALMVRLSSHGPALFRQQRVGKNNRAFTLYKFRSMYSDAEARSGAVWAVRDDPRITPVGRWLRRLRLDELPQLFNVLKGDMSIVGPRPERPEFVSELERRIPYYRQRHCVKPGITGWAQINHKYSDTIEDTIVKLEYDLYYIKNLAPALDALIMFHTAKVMLLSRGAQ